MPRHRLALLRVLAALSLFLLGCPPPQPSRDVILQGLDSAARLGLSFLGETFFLAPDSTGAFILQVRNPDTGAPLRSARVQVRLETPEGDTTADLFSGATDERGVVHVRFAVPDTVADPDQLLVVEARASGHTVAYEEAVYVGRVYNVLISTDKPVYQPGQTIHMRGLALDTLALAPATDEPLVFTVTGPDGNKLMRCELQTSRYGIASADFVIDRLAPSGDYIVTAEMGPVSSTRSVEVKPYSLPRFKVTFAADRPYYLPGATASGQVEAHYFFGRPVSGGQVIIRGFVTDVDRFQVFELNGVTGDDGVFAYEFAVPDYFVGQLDNNTAKVDLEITVVDTANHAETIDDDVTVAEKPILVDGVPESGILRPGVANIVYLDTSYPDGRAAPADLIVASPTLSNSLALTTDDFGLATFVYTPTAGLAATFTVTATDAAGTTAVQPLTFGASEQTTAVLLRPDKAEYQLGETMQLDVHVAGPVATVYLDVIKGRQTFALVSLPVRDGVAQAAIDIDGSLLGTLELNAYVITPAGEIVRDRRLALVNPAPANVTVTADAAEYRPGDTATLDFTVSRDGAPMPSALGISIVDESVFSVEDQDPGFARTYFLLERELLEPRYEIHDFGDLADDDFSPYDDNPDSYRNVHIPGSAPALAARQTALAGLFAEELAAQHTAQAHPQAAPVTSPLAAGWAHGWGYRLALVFPLLGLVIYDGTRRRRRLLAAALLLGVAALILAACAGAAPAAPASEAPASETTATRGQSTPTRLRQYFPETLFWLPELETDAQGHARIMVPVADSITTWRVTVLASDAEGNLGSAETGLRVFQEFFVEPDLPRFLTVGDEIDLPVSLYNYLDEPQTVDLTVQQAAWFELAAPATQSVSLEPHQVAAAYIPIRVLQPGSHDFQVTARGPLHSDAVLRQVEVLPDGQPTADVQNGRLQPQQTLTVTIPAGAIAGTGRATVKLFPGIVSQALAGLEGLLQQPYGCFEQTSSVTYPNILVLDYLRATGQTNPDAEMMAEFYINSGYQRLLTFEVPGAPGGFSLFGDPPPETMLTAYGLMEMTDMSRVSYVDPAVLERMAAFLIERQQENGSWDPAGMRPSGPDADAGDASATAYITWALADAGFSDSDAVTRAIRYLDKAVPVARPQEAVHAHEVGAQRHPAPIDDADAYLLSLVANAYIAAGEPAQHILDRLVDNALPAGEQSLRWGTAYSTWLRAYGDTANLETSAMVIHALLRAGYRLDIAEQALNYLISQRNALGMYDNTQATILVLKTLLLAAQIGGEGGGARVTVQLDDGRGQEITVDSTNADVVQQVSFDDLAAGDHTLTLTLSGDRAMQYQVATAYYLPWSAAPAQQEEAPLRLDVAYDRTELQINDTVQVTATLELLGERAAGTLIVDLGIPPGFTPVTASLDRLVEQSRIARYELAGRQIILYLADVPSGVGIALPYRLQARYPIRAQPPPSIAYDYYTPGQSGSDAPQRVVVTLGTPGN